MIPLIRTVRYLSYSVLICFIIPAFYITLHVSKDTRHSVDAILILGTQSTKNGILNPCLEARVDHGVELFKDGLAPVIIVSGGDDDSASTNEAIEMSQLVEKRGVPKEKILKEGKSTSTFENMTFSKTILDSIQAKTILLVTEPYHSPRAELVAHKVLSQTLYISPAMESVCWKNTPAMIQSFIREVFALLFYFVTGKI